MTTTRGRGAKNGGNIKETRKHNNNGSGLSLRTRRDPNKSFKEDSSSDAQMEEDDESSGDDDNNGNSD